ncbi:hypothetical protein E2C01_077009 [Portunus trituberculatus]|uniref:Uncharacterized protein n=1 Tax=Portunus trituberculatus TaxID=210409 RepID=A0A5B7ID84_PORTR|nr:hypothetical protein [Portunus trituberculatus]
MFFLPLPDSHSQPSRPEANTAGNGHERSADLYLQTHDSQALYMDIAEESELEEGKYLQIRVCKDNIRQRSRKYYDSFLSCLHMYLVLGTCAPTKAELGAASVPGRGWGWKKEEEEEEEGQGQTLNCELCTARGSLAYRPPLGSRGPYLPVAAFKPLTDPTHRGYEWRGCAVMDACQGAWSAHSGEGVRECLSRPLPPTPRPVSPTIHPTPVMFRGRGIKK